jgi:hypothetical protein
MSTDKDEHLGEEESLAHDSSGREGEHLLLLFCMLPGSGQRLGQEQRWIIHKT